MAAPGPSASQVTPGWLVLAAIAFSLTVWSSSFAAIRFSLEHFSPASVAWWRFAIASIIFAVYALTVRMQLPSLREWRGFALSGVLGVCVYQMLFIGGQVSVSAGAASLLLNTSPLFTTLLASLVLGERPGLRGWLGVLLGFAGAAMIAFNAGGGLRFSLGAVLILGAAFVSSVNLIAQKSLLVRYRPLQVTAFTAWSGTLLLSVFAAPRAIAEWQTAPTAVLLVMLFQGVVATALASLTWGFALARVPASRIVGYSYLSPPLAFLIAWVWLGETPTLMTFAGGAVVLLAVMVINSRLPRAG